ncbi:MAG: GrpB family protein [bacterium]
MTEPQPSIGLKPGTVKLVPYSAEWPRKFAEESARIRSALGSKALAVEHIGSTAISGLDAKPIIDMAVAIESLADMPACVVRLSKEGYEYKGEYGLPGRHFFTSGEPTRFHVHVVEQTSNHWRVWLQFREHLLKNETVRNEYNQVKRELAKQHADNRDAYTAGKNPFISRILKQIGAP